MNDVAIIVALASFLAACSNRVEADPAPPGPTSIPTGATSSEVATVALRAPPPPPPWVSSATVVGPVSSSSGEPSSLPGGTSSAAATSSGR